MKPRGRRPGQLANPRDANGWMIPRPGTRRRAVYDALCAGLSWVELGMCRHAFNTHKAYIVRWEKVHVWRKVGELRELQC